MQVPTDIDRSREETAASKQEVPAPDMSGKPLSMSATSAREGPDPFARHAMGWAYQIPSRAVSARRLARAAAQAEAAASLGVGMSTWFGARETFGDKGASDPGGAVHAAGPEAGLCSLAALGKMDPGVEALAEALLDRAGPVESDAETAALPIATAGAAPPIAVKRVAPPVTRNSHDPLRGQVVAPSAALEAPRRSNRPAGGLLAGAGGKRRRDALPAGTARKGTAPTARIPSRPNWIAGPLARGAIVRRRLSHPARPVSVESRTHLTGG